MKKPLFTALICSLIAGSAVASDAFYNEEYDAYYRYDVATNGFVVVTADNSASNTTELAAANCDHVSTTEPVHVAAVNCAMTPYVGVCQDEDHVSSTN